MLLPIVSEITFSGVQFLPTFAIQDLFSIWSRLFLQTNDETTIWHITWFAFVFDQERQTTINIRYHYHYY